MRNLTAKERNPCSLFFRVSVFSEKEKKWFVKHAGISQRKAEAIVASYFEKGLVARLTAC